MKHLVLILFLGTLSHNLFAVLPNKIEPWKTGGWTKMPRLTSNLDSVSDNPRNPKEIRKAKRALLSLEPYFQKQVDERLKGEGYQFVCNHRNINKCLGCRPKKKGESFEEYMSHQRFLARLPHLLLPRGTRKLDQCKRISLLTHGLSDSPAKVTHMAKRMQAKGICVYIAPLRGHMPTFSDQAEDDIKAISDGYLYNRWKEDFVKTAKLLHKIAPDANLQFDGFSTGGLFSLKACANPVKYGLPESLAAKLDASFTMGTPLYHASNGSAMRRLGYPLLPHVCYWAGRPVYQVTSGSYNLESCKNEKVYKSGKKALCMAAYGHSTGGAGTNFCGAYAENKVPGLNRALQGPPKPGSHRAKRNDFIGWEKSKCRVRTFHGSCDRFGVKSQHSQWIKTLGSKGIDAKGVFVGNNDCSKTLDVLKTHQQEHAGVEKSLPQQKELLEKPLDPACVRSGRCRQITKTPKGKEIPGAGHGAIMNPGPEAGYQCFTSPELGATDAHNVVMAEFDKELDAHLGAARTRSQPEGQTENGVQEK
jgi:hypothetical protein